jgi:hypothetical protein
MAQGLSQSHIVTGGTKATGGIHAPLPFCHSIDIAQAYSVITTAIDCPKVNEGLAHSICGPKNQL